MYNQVNIKEKNTCESYADKARDYIYNNFGYDIKVSDIAKYVGIDRTYLYKIFMEEYKNFTSEISYFFSVKYCCEFT